MKPTYRKAKGDKYERELARFLATCTGLVIERAPLSGGGVIGQLSGGADLMGTPGLHVEAKRCERYLFEEWLRQTDAAISKTHAPERPVIMARKNGMRTEDSLVVLRLGHFADLYLAWLRHEGYVRTKKRDDLPPTD